MGHKVGWEEVSSPAEAEREQLLELLADAARLWLAHDGFWFQAVERSRGLGEAIRRDEEAMAGFTVNEANRIMRRLGLAPGGGLRALARALRFRLYAHVNTQDISWPSPDRLLFRMTNCRVQAARRRKGLTDFPCKSVGLVEYEGFARAIDPRIVTHCVACPPDPHPPEYWCAWEFSLGK